MVETLFLFTRTLDKEQFGGIGGSTLDGEHWSWIVTHQSETFGPV